MDPVATSLEALRRTDEFAETTTVSIRCYEMGGFAETDSRYESPGLDETVTREF